jgi:ABC-type transport system involved in multi-copper enzyme maturation permease subunit
VKLKRRCIRAILLKEVREYRRTGSIVWAMAIYPMVFVLTPAIQAFAVPSRAAATLRREDLLLYLLAIPTLVPSTLAAYSVVGERQQGTLEPVLATPVGREEFLLGKALAAFVPSVIISYVVYGAFLAVVEVFAEPAVAAALIRGSEVLAQFVYTPLLAAWSIWVGIAISTRSNDVRTAQQLSALASLPLIAVTSLIAYGVIHPTLRLALGCGLALLVSVRVGYRIVSKAFDRERLVTGSR